jgi:hypothetical protein
LQGGREVVKTLATGLQNSITSFKASKSLRKNSSDLLHSFMN